MVRPLPRHERLMARQEEVEEPLRNRLDDFGPLPALLHVLILPDFDRAPNLRAAPEGELAPCASLWPGPRP